MKKAILLLLTGCLAWNCDLDEGVKFTQEILPIESAILPATFKKDSLYKIPFKYIRPSTCHAFEGFYYQKEDNIRTIAIATTVYKQNNCTTAPINPLQVELQFRPSINGSYIFKLWKGKNAQGQNIFEEVEIPVIP